MQRLNPDSPRDIPGRMPPIPLAIAQLLFASLLLYLSTHPVDLGQDLANSNRSDPALTITIPITPVAVASPALVSRDPSISTPNSAYQN